VEKNMGVRKMIDIVLGTVILACCFYIVLKEIEKTHKHLHHIAGQAKQAQHPATLKIEALKRLERNRNERACN
jgi:hypothetical protein